MNDCVNVEVRDALPDYLNHRLSDIDTVTIRAHLESCAECRAELDLLRSVKAARVFSPPLDYERIGSAVPAYGGVSLPNRQHTSPVTSRPWLFAATAAIVAVGGWLYTRSNIDRTSASPSAVAVSPAVKSVTTESTPQANISETRVAPPPPKEIEIASLSLVGNTDDLSDADLEQLVSELEAIEAAPAEEPTSVTITVDDLDDH